jgi:hypothetical protein
MNYLKLSVITLFVVFLLIASDEAVCAQSAQEATDKTQSSADITKKKKEPDASAPKPQPAIAPASAAPQSNGPASNAPATKPSTAQQSPAAKNAGTVWVNTDSGIYHKPGTHWYGKTKKGKYMTEADAIKAGYHPAKKE